MIQVRQTRSNISMPEDLEVKLKCAAHHEAGHIVIAASQRLKLRPEGLMVDLRGEGLACYCKQAGESDLSRERVVIAAFAGFKAEQRLCDERSYSAPHELGVW